MNLPTIFDWLERLSFLRGMPAAYGVLITGMIILIVWDWRITLLSLVIQYSIAGFLFVDLLDPRLVNIKVLVGLFVCLMLYLTARQVNWGHLPADVKREEVMQVSARFGIRTGPYSLMNTKRFRAFLALMMLLAVLTLSRRPEYFLPAVPAEFEHLHLAIYGLMGMGLLGMGLTSEPLRAGMGILMFLSGFELFYSALEQSVAILAFLAAVNLVIVLVIAYLTHARHAIPTLID